MNLQAQEKMSFEEWLGLVDAQYKFYHGGTHSYTKDTGVDCWRGYYESDYSPEDAYAEDCSHG